MKLLTPDPNHKRPTSAQARAMCLQVVLDVRPLTDKRLISVLDRIRQTHLNGGALFASFDVGPNEDFDWLASRNQLPIFGVLRLLMDRAEVSAALPSLNIQPSKPDDPAFVVHRLGDHGPVDPFLIASGMDADFEIPNTNYEGEFTIVSPFDFDAELAKSLYSGGAYTNPQGDGRKEKDSALSFCEALFDLRYAEVSYYSTRTAWTPWFGNIIWDWTAILLDRRTRVLSILAVTDID